MPLPTLPTASQKSDSILIGTSSGQTTDETEEICITGGKWQDEEERKFFEDVQDLKDFVPSSVLGIEEAAEAATEEKETEEKERIEREREEVKKLEEELERLTGESLEQGRSNEGPLESDLDQDESVICRVCDKHSFTCSTIGYQRRHQERQRRQLPQFRRDLLLKAHPSF